jgi:lipoate-protein ligase A
MLIAHIKMLFPNAIDYQFTPSHIDSINELITTKFSTWEWNYGYSPTYTLNRQIRANNKAFDIEINVEKGIIVKVTIKGNSSISKSIEELEKLMVGCIHEKEEISQRLGNINLKQYIPEIDKESFIENLF